jgi:hypothetical protein
MAQPCASDFNQGKNHTTLIYNDKFSKRSILVKIFEEYCTLIQLLTEDKVTIYEICENYPNIYQTYNKALERIILEREIPEVNWIYEPPGSGKSEFAQDCLKTYDIMRKKYEFIHTIFFGLQKHHI